MSTSIDCGRCCANDGGSVIKLGTEVIQYVFYEGVMTHQGFDRGRRMSHPLYP